MWDVGTILTSRKISNAEFNEFCRSQKAFEGSKRNDPPNDDLIEFDFQFAGGFSTRLSKGRDRDFGSFIEANLCDAELELLASQPETVIFTEITSKSYDSVDLLNFFLTAKLIISKWGGVLTDLTEKTHSLDSVNQEIERIYVIVNR